MTFMELSRWLNQALHVNDEGCTVLRGTAEGPALHRRRSQGLYRTLWEARKLKINPSKCRVGFDCCIKLELSFELVPHTCKFQTVGDGGQA